MTHVLAHLIVDIVRGESSIGGIKAAALSNRIAAVYAKDGEPIPSADEIHNAIIDLVAAECLIVKSARLTVPVATAVGTNTGNPNPSGVYPIGPGDPLFNAAGQQVAVVRAMSRTVDGMSRVMGWHMEVDTTFKEAGSADAWIPGAGEILTGKNETVSWQSKVSGLWTTPKRDPIDDRLEELRQQWYAANGKGDVYRAKEIRKQMAQEFQAHEKGLASAKKWESEFKELDTKTRVLTTAKREGWDAFDEAFKDPKGWHK